MKWFLDIDFLAGLPSQGLKSTPTVKGSKGINATGILTMQSVLIDCKYSYCLSFPWDMV